LEAAEDLNQHLARELFEEVGIKINPGEPFFVWKWNIKKEMANAPSGVDRRRSCDGDNLDLTEWIPLSKIHDYDWIPNMLPVLDSFLTKTAVAS
jgi:8-oxo-dGTP pyrophosphatase MutT (NUDIX family)